MPTRIGLIALVFVVFVVVTDGARINLNRGNSSVLPNKGGGLLKRAFGATTFGTTVPEEWVKDVSKFVCMQKWTRSLLKDTKEFCLVNFEKVKEAYSRPNMKSDKYNVKFPLTWRKCQSSPGKGATPDRRPWALKVCELKGTENVRVSKGSRKHLPKGCFRLTNKTLSPDERTWMFSSGEVFVFEAALSANDCKVLQHIPSRRGLLVEDPFATSSPQEYKDYDYDYSMSTTMTTTAITINENKPVPTTSKTSAAKHYHFHYHSHRYHNADASPPADGSRRRRIRESASEMEDPQEVEDSGEEEVDDEDRVNDEDEDGIYQEADEDEGAEHEDDDEDKDVDLRVVPDYRGSEADMLQSPLAQTPVLEPY